MLFRKDKQTIHLVCHQPVAYAKMNPSEVSQAHVKMHTEKKQQQQQKNPHLLCSKSSLTALNCHFDSLMFPFQGPTFSFVKLCQTLAIGVISGNVTCLSQTGYFQENSVLILLQYLRTRQTKKDVVSF